MLYMLCVSVISILGTIIMIGSMASSLDNIRNGKAPSAKLICCVLLMILLTMAAISPTLFLMYQVLTSLNQDATEVTFTDHSVAFQMTALAASVIVSGCYIYIGKLGFRKIAAAGFISCLLLVFIYGNSVAFLMNDKVGMANITMLRSVSDIDDVNCNADYLLVQLSENARTPTKWRCPTTLILFRDSSRPFIPFPDYQSGSSTKLSAVLHNLINNSRDLSKE